LLDHRPSQRPAQCESAGGVTMATAVRLSVLTGPYKDRRCFVCPPNQCKIGRAKDCFVNLSGTQRDELISHTIANWTLVSNSFGCEIWEAPTAPTSMGWKSDRALRDILNPTGLR